MLQLLKSAMIASIGALLAVFYIEQYTPSIPTIVKTVSPAVVSIAIMKTPEQKLSFFMEDAPSEKAEPEQTGVGSGFIVSKDGYILTNAHVVSGAELLTVTLDDGREFTARVIGFDESTDVALIQIAGEDFTTVTLGNSDDIEVGETVVAIGSPFGLSKTVTSGVVSSKQRETGELVAFIQTDVAINPGNSGGPLINEQAEVVGINSQIYTRSGGYQGVSFAIPINDAVEIAELLRKNGTVNRGRLGVSIGIVTKEIVIKEGLGNIQGALITKVVEDGPAANAGVQVGDVVLYVNSTAIKNPMDLPRAIGRLEPGTQAVIVVSREGKKVSLNVTLGKLD